MSDPFNKIAIKILFMGLIAYILSIQTNINYSWNIQGIWCIVVMIFIVPTLLSITLEKPVLIFIDHRTVATMSFIFYFLIGASFLSFGSQEAIYQSEDIYPTTINEALKIDALNNFGFAVMLFIFSISKDAFLLKKLLNGILSKILVFKKYNIYYFLFILSSIGYYKVMQSNLSPTEEPLNAFFPTMDKFNIILIYLFQIDNGKNKVLFRWLSTLILILQILSGISVLSKAIFFIPIIVYIVGLIVRLRLGLKSISIFFIIFFLLFQPISAVLSASRPSDFIDFKKLSLSDRLEIVNEVLTNKSEVKDSYTIWSRLSYIATQAIAVRFYDDDQAGDELRMIPWLFIPRILAPNKPIISELGSEFYTKYTGNFGSSVGTGVFINGYYNLGWIGLIIFSSIYGWLLRQTSFIATKIVQNNAVLIYPLALFGVNMAYRIDGNFIVDQLGNFVILIYLLFGISILGHFLIKK